MKEKNKKHHHFSAEIYHSAVSTATTRNSGTDVEAERVQRFLGGEKKKKIVSWNEKVPVQKMSKTEKT